MCTGALSQIKNYYNYNTLLTCMCTLCSIFHIWYVHIRFLTDFLHQMAYDIYVLSAYILFMWKVCFFNFLPSWCICTVDICTLAVTIPPFNKLRGKAISSQWKSRNSLFEYSSKMQEEIKSFLKYSKFFTEIQTYILHFFMYRHIFLLHFKKKCMYLCNNFLFC